MALALKRKQTDALVKMLAAASEGVAKSGGDSDSYKVLVLDKYCRDIISPILKVNDLRKHGVTLHLLVDADRQPIEEVPALYFLQASAQNVARIVQDASAGLYDSMYLNFSSVLPRPLMEELAAGAVRNECMGRINKVYDQYMSFVALKDTCFTLMQPRSYVQLNDPTARDTEIEAAVGGIVDGLFSVFVTLGQVPVIRCPKGGVAEHVAGALDQRIRDHLGNRSNLFAESGPLAAAGGGFQRPLLCLFDRNFDLATSLQHTWTYEPLVHEALGLKLNRVDVGKPGVGPAPPADKKSYDLDMAADFFWRENCLEPFPKVAEQVEVELTKYKAAVDDVNRKTAAAQQGGMDEDDAMSESTRNIAKAVASLPELTERKRVIDKHTNIATALLGEIKARQLDAYYQLEEVTLSAKPDGAEVLTALKEPNKGTPLDRLRLALVYVLAAEDKLPPDEAAEVEGALAAAGADVTPLQYVRRLRSMGLTGAGGAGGMVGGMGSESQGNLLDWADKLYGQSISAVAKGVKNLLSSGRQLAVARAVEALMEARPGPESEGYALFDPKTPRGGGGGDKVRGPCRDAVVFVIGGGNFLEHESLVQLAAGGAGGVAAPSAATSKNIVYGATEMLTPAEIIDQLAELGRKSGGI